MNRRISDIVILNVGGTSFTSSVSTLVNSSSYFERRLSEEWRERDPCGEEQVVIDQDPRLFSVLLSYMRLGSIEADKLTTPVILLAVFFGMDQLLEAVRAVAIRSKFEGRNFAIFSAAHAALLVKESDVKKNFASLTILHPDFISFSESRGVNPDFVVFVEVQNEDGTVQTPSNCFTFIDALNFLNKSGYTRYEKEKFEPNQSYSATIVRMWFSKLVTENDVEDMEDPGDTPHLHCFTSETTSIRESDTSMPKKYPREFCYIIGSDQHGDELSHMDLSILEADIGNDEKPVEFRGQLQLLDETSIGKSRSGILDTIDSKIKKYNWLENQGYTTCEHELAGAYSAGISVFIPRDGQHFIVSVWSRPLFE
jgi:hypothetical protein